jgi:hypothetical protein
MTTCDRCRQLTAASFFKQLLQQGVAKKNNILFFTENLSAYAMGVCPCRSQNSSTTQDTSEYQVNEPAPTDEYFKTILTHLLALAAQKPDTLATLRRYVGQWTWLR